MSHTKEPWSKPYYHDSDDGDRGWWIHNGKQGGDEYAIAVTFSLNPNEAADARRIVACVNACAGFDTDDLVSATNDKRHRHEIIRDLVEANRRIEQLEREKTGLEQRLEAQDRYIQAGRQNTIIACPECPKMIAIAGGKV